MSALARLSASSPLRLSAASQLLRLQRTKTTAPYPASPPWFRPRPLTLADATSSSDRGRRTSPGANMFADLRILTPPASDTPSLPPVLATFGPDRYLFNVGEATSRSFTQRKANLSKVTDIFVPRVAWDAIGGLPGTLMSLADGNRTSVRLHGPPNLLFALASMRTYAKRDTMQLSTNEVDLHSDGDAASGSHPIHEDDNLVVHAVTLLPDSFGSQQHRRSVAGLEQQVAKKVKLDSPASDRLKSPYTEDELSAAAHKIGKRWTEPGWNPTKLRGAEAGAWVRMTADSLFNGSLIEKRLRAIEQGVTVGELESEARYHGPGFRPPRTPAFVVATLPPNTRDFVVPTTEGEASAEQGGQAPVLAFICQGRSQRGKFNATKAIALGVVPGPSFNKLTHGADVVVTRPKVWEQMDEAARKAWANKQRRTGTRGISHNSGGPDGKGNKRGKKNKGGKDNTAAAPGAEAEHPDPPEWADVEEVTVKSSDVLGQERIGPVFIQVHLPSASYIASLVSPASLARFQPYTAEANAGKPEEQRQTPQTIVHAVPVDVLGDERYQQWMASFGPDCHHIIANADVCANKLMFPSSSTIPLRLSRLDDQIFKVPQYQLAPRVRLDEIQKRSPALAQLQLYPAEADQLVQLHPRTAPKHFASGAPDFDFELGSEQAELLASFEAEETEAMDEAQDRASEAVGERKSKKTPAAARAELGLAKNERLQEARKKAWAEYLEAVATAKQQLQREEQSTSRGRVEVAASDDVLITTLGTGSAVPSKYRNVISTLIQTPRDGNILLDAGEGTLGLLRRKFGSERDGTASPSGKGEDADAILRNLRCLFISHIHADHHIGLINLLLARRKLSPRPSAPLHLVATSFVHMYLREYSSIEDLGLDDDVVQISNEFLDSRDGVDPLADAPAPATTAAAANGAKSKVGSGSVGFEHARTRHIKLNNDAKAALNLAHLHTARVDHRASHCYGLVVRHASGWSLTYSGDTRPSSELIAAGRGSTVLIHEATLEDSQQTMAIAKGHSTFGEAISVARQMGVDNLLLTHFSQRYPKMARSSLFAASETGVGEGEGDAAAGGGGGKGKKMPIALAFDLVTYPLSKFERIQRYTPALEKLFAADFEGEGEEEASSSVVPADGEESAMMVDVSAGSSGKKSKSETTTAATTMTIDGPSSNGGGGQASMDVDEPMTPASKPDDTAITASGTPQASSSSNPPVAIRKSFHPRSWSYVLLRIKPSIPPLLLPLSPQTQSWLRQSVCQIVTPSLVHSLVKVGTDQLLGVVGGSFGVDVLHIPPPFSRLTSSSSVTAGDVEEGDEEGEGGAEGWKGVDVVLRCESRYAQDLTSSLSLSSEQGGILPTLTLPSNLSKEEGEKEEGRGGNRKTTTVRLTTQVVGVSSSLPSLCVD